jgi:sulfite exporter TauE/SafE
MTAMTVDPVQTAYAQILSLGVLWISVHCVGMCGPLLIGLDVAGVRCGARPFRGALSVLTYQAGKALTYAFLGGLCGILGAGLRRGFAPAGAVLSLVLSVLMFGAAWRRLRPRRQQPLLLRRGPVSPGRGTSPTSPGGPGTIEGWLRRLLPALSQPGARSPLRDLFLGAVMGFLPCMIVLWALGLSALTGSALHGAAIMLILVMLTTPMLLGVTLLPRILRRPLSRIGGLLPSALLTLSGLWLLLIGAAGLGLVDHAHLGFSALGKSFTLMFF